MMEVELESGLDKVQEHANKLCRAIEKPPPAVIAEAGEVHMDLLEKEWPNQQPFVKCPKPKCRELGSFTKAGTARGGQIIKCLKCHKRVTGEQVTKLLELYAPEPEARLQHTLLEAKNRSL